MIASRQRIASIVLLVGLVGAAYLCLSLLWAIASHAAGVAEAEATTVVAQPGLTVTDVIAWIAFGLSIGVAILHFVAPRTKATWDDELLDKLEQILFAVKPPGAAALPPKVERGMVSPAMIGILSAIAALAIGASSCARAKEIASAGAKQMLDCTAGDRAAVVGDLTGVGEQWLLSKLSPDGKAVDTAALRASAKALKTDAGRCLVSTAFALLLNAPKPAPGAPAAAELAADPAALRAAFETLRSEWGVGTVQTSAGAL